MGCCFSKGEQPLIDQPPPVTFPREEIQALGTFHSFIQEPCQPWEIFNRYLEFNHYLGEIYTGTNVIIRIEREIVTIKTETLCLKARCIVRVAHGKQTVIINEKIEVLNGGCVIFETNRLYTVHSGFQPIRASWDQLVFNMYICRIRPNRCICKLCRIKDVYRHYPAFITNQFPHTFYHRTRVKGRTIAESY